MSSVHADERSERMFPARIPRTVAQSYSDEQLTAIKTVFGAERWDHHRLDFRSTLWLPFRRWYFVFLARPQVQRVRNAVHFVLGAATSAVMVIWLVLTVVYLLIPEDLLPLFPGDLLPPL